MSTNGAAVRMRDLPELETGALPDRLTLLEVAEVIGVSRNTVHRHFLSCGRLTRLPDSPVNRARYARADSLRLAEEWRASEAERKRATVEKMAQTNRQKVEALYGPGAVTPCKSCGAQDRYPSGGCRPCLRRHARQWRQKYPERAHQVARQYRETHREQIRDQRRRYWQRMPEDVRKRRQARRSAQWRDVEAGARRRGQSLMYYRDLSPASKAIYNRRARERERLKGAIADGKCSPVCKRVGFMLVRYSRARKPEAWDYRAARSDKPHQFGEAACAEYEWSPTRRRWLIHQPRITGAGWDAKLFERLERANEREEGPEKGRGL